MESRNPSDPAVTTEPRLKLWTAVIVLIGALLTLAMTFLREPREARPLMPAVTVPVHVNVEQQLQTGPPPIPASSGLTPGAPARQPGVVRVSSHAESSCAGRSAQTLRDIVREARDRFQQQDLARALGAYRCAYDKLPPHVRAQLDERELMNAFDLESPTPRELASAVTRVHTVFSGIPNW